MIETVVLGRIIDKALNVVVAGFAIKDPVKIHTDRVRESLRSHLRDVEAWSTMVTLDEASGT